jgi:hypothetical protein
MADSIVRLAAPEDAAAIFDLCVMLHAENGLFPLSERKVRAMIDRAFNKEGAIIGVIGEIGKPVASIYLGLSQTVYSDSWALFEEFNFVAPEHRRTDYSKQLIAFAKSCSDKMQLPLLTGILSNQRTEAKVRLYERQLDKAGAYFVYNRQLSGATAWDAKQE